MARKRQGRDEKRIQRYKKGGRAKAMKYAKGGMVCRGMGAAKRGGKFSKDG